MKKWQWVIPAVIFIALIALSGCSKSDDNNNPVGPGPGTGSNTQTINPGQGGSVTYGSASVTIPPGALDDTTDISVAIPTSPPSYTQPANTAQIGSTYQFGPDTATFNVPVTVTFTYDQAAIGTYSESSVTIMSFESPGQAPTALTNVAVNQNTNTVTGTTTHFSYFVLIISTGGGGGPVVIPPHPQGGNPVGNWTFASLSVDTTENGNFRVSMTGTGSGNCAFQATAWTSDLTLTTFIRTEMYEGGEWFLFHEDTVTTHEHIWGTYVIDNDTTLVTTITGSDTNPEYIGDVRTDGFTATPDWMVLYQKTSPSLPEYNMFVVYTK
jgi:hypothetical protein